MNDHSLPVHVTVDDSKGYRRVAVSGEVDLSNAHVLARHLEGIEGDDYIVIDLRDVPFMDSTGLNAVAQFGKRMKEEGTRVSLLITRPVLRKVFDVTGLSQHFPVAASEAELAVL